MKPFPSASPYSNPPEDLFDTASANGSQLDPSCFEDDPIDGDDDHQSASDPENDDFYFESDHLALRGNPDYTAVLRTIAILQTQRIQVTKDIDVLATAERQALDDPEGFVRRLGAGEVRMPGPVNVVDVSCEMYFVLWL